MLKMILADDEPVITRGIRKLIDWEKLGISIAGEYGDGKSAMEGILSQSPSLALLDISMPGMNGIEILKSIRELELSTKVIFISGFQDFEYARNALTYGAVDYLLKPVIREELLRAVEKAVSRIQGEGAKAEERPVKEGNAGQKTLLMEETTYLPVLADVLFDGDESGQEKKLIRFSLISFLEEYLSEKKLGILFQKNDHIVMVLKGMGSDEAKAALTRLWQESVQAAGKKTAFVAGQAVDSMGRIPEQYEKCLDLSRYFFFADQFRIPVLTVGEAVFSQKAGMRELTESREKMTELLISQDREAFLEAFARFARVLCLASDGRREDACYYFCSTVRLTEEKVRSLKLAGRDPDVKELLEQGRSCANFSRMQEIFREYMTGYLELLKNAMESSEKKDILLAREYIERHYRENLTLEVLAKVVHMNPYYFSSFFKKSAGENFKDYVNQVRIRHAVSLLLTTDLKTYEIAAEVGFRDVRSFTEVFSRTYGETPNGYKKRVLSSGQTTEK